MARFKDLEWSLPGDDSTAGVSVPSDVVHSALLMDIRDELRRLNRLLGCTNFLDVPRTLRDIRTAVRRLPARPRKRKNLP
jgi:hypothetical protein